MSDQNETTCRIRQLNDRFRTSFIGGKVLQTEGISALPEADQSRIRELVETFDDFTEGNDPYGEHDFGSIQYNDMKIFWKIDYYNKSMSGGSENPADPAQTCRVLTIMLASEY